MTVSILGKNKCDHIVYNYEYQEKFQLIPFNSIGCTALDPLNPFQTFSIILPTFGQPSIKLDELSGNRKLKSKEI